MKFMIVAAALMSGDPMIYSHVDACESAADKISALSGYEDAVCIPAPDSVQQEQAVKQEILDLFSSTFRLTQDQ